MVKYVKTLCYSDEVDGCESGWLDDDLGELEVQGVKYKDVFEPNVFSCWHDG